jgi:hypothetical protein
MRMLTINRSDCQQKTVIRVEEDTSILTIKHSTVYDESTLFLIWHDADKNVHA